MYLSKLTLYGFKSFAKKTELTFSGGLSAIVGPNGCGKTNILDAIRWVIGEQKVKALRSSSMQDVIFKGTRDRKPLGMAEVTLVLEDCKGLLPFDPQQNTVAIGRRLYRSGDSEYLINNRAVRLKDIQSILMGTGIGSAIYSLIDQAMVQRILNGTKQDRRSLLEEAAGIMKYKIDRNSSQRKLDNAEQDLERLDDILSEIKKRLNSLKRQVRRSKDLEKLKKKEQKIALELSSAEFKQINSKRNIVSEKLNDENQVLAGYKAKKNKIETNRQTASLKRDEHQNKVTESGNNLRKVESEIAAREKEHAVIAEKINSAEKTILGAQNLSENQKSRLVEIEKQLTENSQKIEEKKQQVFDSRKIADEILEKQTNIEEDYAKIRKNNNNRRETLSSLKVKITTYQANVQSYKTQINNLDETREKLISKKESAQEKLDKITPKKTDLDNEITQLEDDIKTEQGKLSKQKLQLDNLREKKTEVLMDLGKLNTHKTELKARLEALQEMIKDSEIDLSAYHGVVGKIAELIEPAELPARSIDTILGPLSEAWVVENSTVASQISKELLDSDKSLILVVLNELPIVTSEITGAKSRFTPLLNLIDGYVTGDLKSEETFVVSQSGNFLKKPGIRIVGAQEKGQLGLITEIKKIKAELEKIAPKIEVLGEKENSLKAEINDLANAMEAVRNQIEELSRKQNEISNQLREIEYQRKNFSNNIQSVEIELDNNNSKREILSSSLQKSQKLIGELETQINSVESELSKDRDSENKAESAVKEITRKSTDAQMKYIQLKGELESLEKEFARLKLQKSEAENSIANSKKLIEDTTKSVKDHESKKSNFNREIEEMFREKEKAEKEFQIMGENLQQANDKLRKLDSDLKDINLELSKYERITHELTMEKRDLDMEIEWIKKSTWEKYQINIEEFEVEEELQEEDRNKKEGQLERLRKRIQSFGGVNPEAEVEYEDEKKRYDFLTEQKEDLLEAKTELKKTIRQLDNTARKLFLETFESARRNFREIFTRLFEGGEADLNLAEGEDVLEADIEISARPRGKRFLSIDQLSAGENALCALSLLFGLYEVKPSPFCMLDEIDAPLDDANVTRFLTMLRRFSEKTQFISITHNRNTMEFMDYIYGITMQEDGISKAISLKMSDLALEFGE